jgi:site-specific recombinase XerD
MTAMAPAAQRTIDPTALSEIKQLLISYQRDGARRNLRPLSLHKRNREIVALFAWLESHGALTSLADVTSQDIDAYLTHQLERLKASTVQTHYLILHAFFNWLEREEEIAKSPMRRMQAPKAPMAHIPILDDYLVSALLATCKGNTFRAKRDLAILRLLLDTGLRASELLAMQPGHIDWQKRTIVIPRGKGGDPRVVAFGQKVAYDLDRYARVRAKQPKANDPKCAHAFWLTQRGRMCYMSLWRVTSERGKQIGIPGLRPHRLRHQFAHEWLAAGGQEGSLMALGGWRNRAMLDRYGRSGRQQRALQEHAQFGPGDRY